jgi:hypothetical protein
VALGYTAVLAWPAGEVSRGANRQRVGPIMDTRRDWRRLALPSASCDEMHIRIETITIRDEQIDAAFAVWRAPKECADYEAICAAKRRLLDGKPVRVEDAVVLDSFFR